LLQAAGFFVGSLLESTRILEVLERMWQLDGLVANWQAPAWSVEVDVARPELGYRLSIGGLPVWHQARLCQMAIGGGRPPIEVYTRGADLVAIYSESETLPLRSRVYWRVVDSELAAAATIDLIVSRQTDLLDSDPAIEVRSTLPGQECYQVDVASPAASQLEPATTGGIASDRLADWNAWLWRLADTPYSFAQVVHGPDCRSVTLETGQPEGGTCLSVQLFGERLEKGVVRQARLRGLIVPDDKDVSLLASRCQQLREADPPLTT
jgi:hypothetical protein